MKTFLLGLCLFLAASTTFVAQAADPNGKCFSSQKLKCPNTEDCADSGYSYVSDCLDCEGNLNTDNESKECFTRKIFNAKENPSPQYLWRDILGMCVWFCAAGVATACGVGGGGIYVPLGILLLNFAPKPASGLSQASIFGASLGGLLLNLRNKHPYTAKIEQTGEVAGGNGSPEGERAEANIPTNEDGEPDTAVSKYYTRPLIDYDMALFLAPMEMAGAVLGVLIQKILPNWLYLFTAAVILGFTAKKTFHKWWDTRAKEMAKQAKLDSDATSQEKEALAATTDGENPKSSTITTTTEIGQGPTPSSSKDGGEEIEITANIPDLVANEDDKSSSDPDEGLVDSQAGDEIFMDAEKIAKRIFFLERDSRQYPVEKLVCFGVLWIGLTLLTFFKGGKGVESLVGIDCTSPWYGVLIGIQFLWTFGFAAYFGMKLMRETTVKKSVGYPFHSQDVLWDFQKTRFYAFFTFVAGIVAGLIGIGGGMVLGPLMLVMGIYPRVSTATTATMIVLTSSSVAILYITSGLVPWEYALTFFCTCFTGALIGKTYIDGYVKKTGKSSVLIFLLAMIIALATLGALVIALLRLSAAEWCFAGFKNFCSIDDGTKEIVCAPSETERMLGSAFYGDVVRGY
mmetsp:Transcript_26324/g.56439  ORF Transcript_26324/g.56439 Transcript_26324/m.56439 type:complete len:628 (+) Transcript_26324:734-2617(+)|eukprot:CAMPEP_0201129794 /NCGR_PEP_ID=MMETSP0850-20130426/38027_1 /ASSEMBLY_ACC=CAM_ASM_000622 /TAXON_ID=183588 /ORGANISM="Pseudo-nitzschia fraudulenta, Strain WWA7" /LENGTH=627 /DNA_ID=CAMNT_0047399375 /DNA_START=540 /DNA_END=2423 /DNA_ORIENTATION=+